MTTVRMSRDDIDERMRNGATLIGQDKRDGTTWWFVRADGFHQRIRGVQASSAITRLGLTRIKSERTCGYEHREYKLGATP